VRAALLVSKSDAYILFIAAHFSRCAHEPFATTKSAFVHEHCERCLPGSTSDGGYTAPDATTGLDGMDEPPEGSAVMSNSVGDGFPDTVNVT
jgi:hypothetical protein